MEFMDVIRRRRSIRNYTSENVPEETLANVLEAARLAPSGSNRQSWKFVVVRDKVLKVKLAAACNKQLWIGDAEIVVVGCYLPVPGIDDIRLRRDVTIAFEHMALAATNEGLGACWIGAFDPESVKSILGIPKDVGVNALMSMGYPAEQPRPRMIKRIEEIVSHDSYM